MKLSTLAVICIAIAVVVFAARNFKQDSDASSEPTEQAAGKAPATVPVSPIKTVTSNTCGADGCPVSCEPGDTMLSAFCVAGSKARFADTLQMASGKLTATCGMGASSVVMYCGRP